MNFDKEPEIEVWNIHDPINPDEISVHVNQPTRDLPPDYRQMVSDEWAEFTKGKPDAKDGTCFYMQTYTRGFEGLSMGVEQRKFSINQAFNRGKGLPNGRRVSAENGVAGIFTSMLYVLTRDADGTPCVLYGDKATYDPTNPRADQFAMTSIAGGIANDKDLNVDGNSINLRRFFERLVRGEAGEKYLERINNMSVVGLVYRDIVPNRGFDLTGIVKTDLETGKAVEDFKANPQFKKKPTPVRLTASDLCDFLQGPRLQTFSNQALASAYIVAKMVQGDKVADEVLDHINRNWKSHIHLLKPSLPDQGGNVFEVLKDREYMGAS